MKAKLSSEIIVKQKVGQHPHINVTDNDDMEQVGCGNYGNDELLEKYMSGKPFKNVRTGTGRKTGDSKTERYFPFITEALKTIWGFGSL